MPASILNIKFFRLSAIQRRYLKARCGTIFVLCLWLLRFLSNITYLKHPYNLLLSKLIQRTQLLYPAYYLEYYGDVAENGMCPYYHFAAYGDKEVRFPNPLFHPSYYKAQAKSQLSNVNSLVHYFYSGQYRLHSPSVWFDIQFYMANNKDIINLDIEPLTHYLVYGGLEGRDPNPQFDGNFYLREYQEFINNNTNPLLHYLQYGRFHGFKTRDLSGNTNSNSQDGLGAQVNNSVEQLFQQILDYAKNTKQSFSDSITLDIIIPVYSNTFLTLKCIASVLQTRAVRLFDLIIINDASPENNLRDYLKILSECGLIKLVENKLNHGFVYSVNQGMRLNADRDVILLNSDTEVFGNWVDRLTAAAYKSNRIACVTPLSNNATICSYPAVLHDNPYSLEISYERLDQMTASLNCDVLVDAPTGVGFCFYIKREAIDDVGFFDQETFGLGYGEENDWCQRAALKGWRSVIAVDTFVYHVGNVSFGGAKHHHLKRAISIMHKRYPNYNNDVQSFIKEDPLRRFRKRLDWGRLQLQAASQNVLMIGHNRGGGSERHLQEDTQRYLSEGRGVFFLRPVRGASNLVYIQSAYAKQLPNIDSFVLKDIEVLARAINQLNIKILHSHGLVDYEADAPRYLIELANVLKADLIVDIHDYKVICPRISLVDHTGMYCGEPSENSCNDCLNSTKNSFGATNIKNWRDLHYEVLRGAKSISAPSYDAQARLIKYFPLLNIEYNPHHKLPRKLNTRTLKCFDKSTSGSVRVVVIGAISAIKGFNVLLDCSKHALRNKIKIEFIVMGYTLNDKLFESNGGVVTGRYQESEADKLLAKLSPDVIWFPAVWPETYSYTLDIAIDSGRPILAFNLGAIPERLNLCAQAKYSILPLLDAKNPLKVIECLMKLSSLNSMNN